MRTDITPTYRSDSHVADWTARDERVSLRLAAFATWATGSFVAALGVIPDVVTLIVTVPIAVACWHLSDTVERRRARAAIRFSQSIRHLEEREHRGLLGPRYDLESVARGARRIAESGVDTRTAGENLRRNLGRASS